MLVRKLSQGKAWRDLLSDTPEMAPMELSAEMFSEFMPSLKDESWLSLYEIASDDECAEIAAALSFLLKPAQVSEQFFFSVERQDLQDAGFEIRSTVGQTFHSKVDSKHCEVLVGSMQSAFLLAKAFLTQGELVSVKGSQIESARSTSMRSGAFRIADVANKPKLYDNSCGHILVHVAQGRIVPVDLPTGGFEA